MVQRRRKRCEKKNAERERPARKLPPKDSPAGKKRELLSRTFLTYREHPRDCSCVPSRSPLPPFSLSFSLSSSIFITTAAEKRVRLALLSQAGRPRLGATRAASREPRAARDRPAVRWRVDSNSISFDAARRGGRLHSRARARARAPVSVIGNKFRNKLPVTLATHPW